LYFVRDLPVGHILGTDDLRRIRPGHGLPPKYLDDVLGKTLQKDVFRGDPVRLDDFIN
jgi:N-acetylneuraminate synthase